MSPVSGERPVDTGVAEPTVASLWQGVSGSVITDELLDWPPDVFAFTDVVLERSGALRFVLSPPAGARWPPSRFARWGDSVEGASRDWGVWVETREGSLPGVVVEEWGVVRERVATPLEWLAEGRDWRMCEALLTLHAVSDEACAGLFVALDRSSGDGCVYRARGRELLARTGSLARIHSGLLPVLPKIRTPPHGRAAFSRYACVGRPALGTRWHKVPARHPGIGPQSEHVNMLLLPWPLRVRESDFRAVEGSVRRLSHEPYGFFEFAPTEGLDLDLVDRTLRAALEEVSSIDAVVLPESAVDENEIPGLEALLDHHGVIYLQTGVRQSHHEPDQFGANWMHIGVNASLEKGRSPRASPREPWFHVRQNKHHRWSLDEQQIFQYHLGGALNPRIQWWEAMEIPPTALQFVQVGEGMTIVSLICEDLAQNDDVAEVVRSVGPTVVMAVLLDGPQLASRWAARYASVLADDPGSAVLTLTSVGMAQRSKPVGHDASRIIALIKDPERGTREISLEPDAQGVLLTLTGERATRRSADGRWPVTTGTHYYGVAIHQVQARAPAGGSGPPPPEYSERLMEVTEITILTGWAEGLAEALAHAPEQAQRLLSDAGEDAEWRHSFGLAKPTPSLAHATRSFRRALAAATPESGPPSFDAVLVASQEEGPDEQPMDRLARRVLRSALEQLRTWQQSTTADSD